MTSTKSRIPNNVTTHSSSFDFCNIHKVRETSRHDDKVLPTPCACLDGSAIKTPPAPRSHWHLGNIYKRRHVEPLEWGETHQTRYSQTQPIKEWAAWRKCYQLFLSSIREVSQLKRIKLPGRLKLTHTIYYTKHRNQTSGRSRVSLHSSTL